MSFWINDKDKGIWIAYAVFLEEVLLDFDSRWTGSKVEIYKAEGFLGRSGVVKGCGRWVGPRSLEWVPFPCCFVDEEQEIHVQYGEDNDGPPHTIVVAGREDVAALARGAEYQHGSARLEIKQDFRCGASTVRLIVQKVDVLQYQQELMEINVPYTFQGNEHDIEQTPESPWQDNPNAVTNDVRHVALEWLPLVLKCRDAQSEAIEQSLSWQNFLWELGPNGHETRVVRRPSAQTDTPLRDFRPDISMHGDADAYDPIANLSIGSIPNHSSQIIEISPDSQSADRVITTSGAIHVNGPLQIMGSMIMGDVFSAPIYGGNVGGQNNTHHFTAPATIETMVHAVLRAMCSETAGEGSFKPQTGRGTNRKRARARHDDEAGVAVGPPRKRRTRQSLA